MLPGDDAHPSPGLQGPAAAHAHDPRPILRRSGFSLVELLIVITIIGTLVAMLLPAIQSARESARQSQCGNNLKQLMLGLHGYESGRRSFPAGFVVTTGSANAESWAWGTLILPYIEQADLYGQLKVAEGNLHQIYPATPAGAKRVALRAAMETPLTTFMCPSEQRNNGGPQGADFGQVGFDRRFTGGIGFAAAGAYWPGASNYVGAAGHWQYITGTSKNTGIFYGNSNVKPGEIIDGLSTTIAIGERDTKNCRGAAWMAIRNPNGTDTRGLDVATAHARAKINEAAVPWDDNPLGCGQSFSSLHPGGAQVAFCDGSVRFLSETIEHNHRTVAATQTDSVRQATVRDSRNGVYQRLMSRNDTLQVSVP
jgi:prepilin-type N-terminal cleavage/methylation domain-containing protein/prepilin-type processing-associated H-X9-DG protein